MIKLLPIILILLISGCVTQRRCDRKFPAQSSVTVKDSIIRTTNTVYRDTTVYVYIKGETKYSTDTVYIKNGMAYSRKDHLMTSFADSWAWVQNGRLYHELIQKDTLIGQQVKDAVRLTWERAERFYTKNDVQVEEVRVVPWWAWWCLAISVLSVSFISFKIVKLFNR